MANNKRKNIKQVKGKKTSLKKVIKYRHINKKKG